MCRRQRLHAPDFLISLVGFRRQSPHLVDRMGHTVPDARLGGAAVDSGQFPGYAAAATDRVCVVQVSAVALGCPVRVGSRRWWCSSPLLQPQGPGDVFVVPSNWYHQVHNLTDCVSVNHNWFNAAAVGKASSVRVSCSAHARVSANNATACLRQVWKYMLEQFHEVQRSIHDCRQVRVVQWSQYQGSPPACEGTEVISVGERSLSLQGNDEAYEWELLCQKLLKAHIGMNVVEVCTCELSSTVSGEGQCGVGAIHPGVRRFCCTCVRAFLAHVLTGTVRAKCVHACTAPAQFSALLMAKAATLLEQHAAPRTRARPSLSTDMSRYSARAMRMQRACGLLVLHTCAFALAYGAGTVLHAAARCPGLASGNHTAGSVRVTLHSSRLMRLMPQCPAPSCARASGRCGQRR